MRSAEGDHVIASATVGTGSAPYGVLLANRGNPDYSQDPEGPLPGGPDDEVVPALDLLHASVICQRYIAEHALGSGNWGGGSVTDERGNIVARVAYNGRVFGGSDLRHLQHEAPAAGCHPQSAER